MSNDPRAAHVPLFAALVAALVAGCAAAPEGEPCLYLETDTYTCGAAEGLGCGLALQPVLVQLDGLDGVAHSQVSWNGRFVRVQLAPGADADRVATAVAAVLEGEEQRISAGAAREVESWFGAECCLDLSLYEAGVLASRFAADMAADAGLDAEDARRLEAVLLPELEQAFRQAHADGGSVYRLWEQLPGRWAAFEAQLTFLEPEQRAKIVAFRERELGP